MAARALRALVAAAACAVLASVWGEGELREFTAEADPLLAVVKPDLFDEGQLDERCEGAIGYDNKRKWARGVNEGRHCDALAEKLCTDWYKDSALLKTACKAMFLKALTAKRSGELCLRSSLVCRSVCAVAVRRRAQTPRARWLTSRPPSLQTCAAAKC